MCGEGFEGERNAQNRNQSMASRFSTAFVGMFTNHFLMEIVAARPQTGLLDGSVRSVGICTSFWLGC